MLGLCVSCVVYMYCVGYLHQREERRKGGGKGMVMVMVWWSCTFRYR